MWNLKFLHLRACGRTVSGADTPTKAGRVIGRVHLQYFLNVSALLPFRLPTPNKDIHYFLQIIYGPFNKVDYMNLWFKELEGIFANLTVTLYNGHVFIKGFCTAYTVNNYYRTFICGVTSLETNIHQVLGVFFSYL